MRLLALPTLGLAALLFLSFAQLAPAVAQHVATRGEPSSGKALRGTMSPLEQRSERAVAAAAASPPRLRALLVRMPKGADLHMHLSGAVYAETFLEDARADLLCASPTTHALVKNIGATASEPVCPAGTVPAANAFTDQALYDALLDAFSMRTFVPSTGISGHDHFFATFDRYDPTHSAGARHGGEWLDEVASRAQAQNEQYLEIMHTPDLGGVFASASLIPWPTSPVTTGAYAQDTTGTSDDQLAAARKTLLASPIFQKALTADQAEFTSMLRARREREHCAQPTATPACDVEIHFLFQVLRALPTANVFVQTLLGFELAERDHAHPDPLTGPTVVGINFVQPEDWRVPMAEYTRQMRIIGYLHTLYPDVHISLHAGELADGMVPPEGERFHIRQAVEIAHAERIGHGIDVMHEDDAAGLLREMAARHIMTEINLTSNDVILNVKGADHPLASYRAAHVPVALSTDDEGVSRIDLTHEFVRGVTEQHLTYLDLKRMVRTSLEHSFLPGPSLWASPDVFTQPIPACARQPLGAASPTAACATALAQSRRAAQQWELERRFTAFEQSLP